MAWAFHTTLQTHTEVCNFVQHTVDLSMISVGVQVQLAIFGSHIVLYAEPKVLASHGATINKLIEGNNPQWSLPFCSCIQPYKPDSQSRVYL